MCSCRTYAHAEYFGDIDLAPYHHYSDVIMSATSSQIIGVSIVCSVACSGAYQRQHQSSASPAFVWEIHRWPKDSPNKGPVTQKNFSFDEIIMVFEHCRRTTIFFNVTMEIWVHSESLFTKRKTCWNKMQKNFRKLWDWGFSYCLKLGRHQDSTDANIVGMTLSNINRKCQNYVYIKWEYWSTM